MDLGLTVEQVCPEELHDDDETLELRVTSPEQSHIPVTPLIRRFKRPLEGQ